MKDFENEPIIDTFSSNELQKIIVDQKTQYDIDKILCKRKRKGKSHVLLAGLVGLQNLTVRLMKIK